MTTPDPAPIACTLTPVDLRERIVELAALTREALQSSERAGLALTLRYMPEAADRVRQMIAKERECCAFLTFAVDEVPGSLQVTITAPERARAVAAELFAQFTGEAIT